MAAVTVAVAVAVVSLSAITTESRDAGDKLSSILAIDDGFVAFTPDETGLSTDLIPMGFWYAAACHHFLQTLSPLN